MDRTIHEKLTYLSSLAYSTSSSSFNFFTCSRRFRVSLLLQSKYLKVCKCYLHHKYWFYNIYNWNNSSKYYRNCNLKVLKMDKPQYQVIWCRLHWYLWYVSHSLRKLFFFFSSQAKRVGKRQNLDARKKLHKPELFFLPKHGRFGNFNMINLPYLLQWHPFVSLIKRICISAPVYFLRREFWFVLPYILSLLSTILQAQSGLRSRNFTCPVRILQVSDIGLVLSFEYWSHLRFVCFEINRIYHRIAEGTRESHPSVHDLESMMRLDSSWMLQILDTRMGFPHPFRNVAIDYFSPTPFFFHKSATFNVILVVQSTTLWHRYLW